VTRSWLRALDAGGRYKVLGWSVPRASDFAYLRNHEPTRRPSGFVGAVGRNDSTINTTASELGYTLK